MTMRPARFIVPASHDARPSVSMRSPSWHISTTVGRFVFIVFRYDSLAKRLELFRDLIPRIALDDERTSGLAKFSSSPFIVQEGDHCGRDCFWIVRGDEFLVVSERETLSADRRRYDRLRHAEGFEELHARAAAHAEPNDVHGRFVEIRSHVTDSARHNHAKSLGSVPQPLRGIT